MPKLKKFVPYTPKPAPESHPCHRISTHQIALGIVDRKDYLRPNTITQMQIDALAKKYLKEHEELLRLRETNAKFDYSRHRNDVLQQALSTSRAQCSDYAYRNRKYVGQLEAARAEIKALREFGKNEAAIMRAHQKVIERQKRKKWDTSETLEY